MRKILLAVVTLSLLAGSTAQAFPFKKKKKKAKTEQTATPPAPKESAFDKQVKGAKHLPGVIDAYYTPKGTLCGQFRPVIWKDLLDCQSSF